MPRPASPKRTVYSYKKIMLTMILVFFGVCVWPAYTLVCHDCNISEHCTNQVACTEDEAVCIMEVLKKPNSTHVRKTCYSNCEDYIQEEAAEENSTESNPTISEVSQRTDQTIFLFRQGTSQENIIVCCESDLCNQARARGPGDTALVFGFLLSFMWFIHCSIL